MKRTSTIKDIADLLHTTAATVSRALNDSPEISVAMKKKVLDAARRLDYEKNKVASSLRLGETKMIGVIIPSAEHNFFGSVIHGIVNIAEKHGYDILIHQSNESHVLEEKGIQAFLAARVDGILASLAKDTVDFSHFLLIKKKKLPIVFFDRINDTLGIPTVSINDYDGAYRATEHLLKQGYSRIAHISGPKHMKIFGERLRGFSDALKAAGQDLDDALIYPGEISIESGKAGLDFLLKLKKPPDAIFAAEDFTALGVINELKERGIRTPEEFGVIGFCNEMFGQHISPSLSTVDQQTLLLGEEAFKLLYKIIREEKIPRSPSFPNLILDAVPVFRRSSVREK